MVTEAPVATAKRERQKRPNNPTTSGFRLSEEMWDLLHPLLPTHPTGKRGRPRVSDRRCADAIFYVLRTGCQWAALDVVGDCPHSTAYDRFAEWQQAGVFLTLWEVALARCDECKGIEWEWLSLDGAMTKAPLGGEKNRRQSDGPGQERGEAEPAHGWARGAVSGRDHRS